MKTPRSITKHFRKYKKQLGNLVECFPSSPSFGRYHDPDSTTMTKAVILWDANGWMTQGRAVWTENQLRRQFPIPALPESSHSARLLSSLPHRITASDCAPQTACSRLKRNRAGVTESSTQLFALPLCFSSPSATFGETPSLSNLTRATFYLSIRRVIANFRPYAHRAV